MLSRSQRALPGSHGTVEIVRGDSKSHNGSIFTAQIAFSVHTPAAANAAIAIMRQASHASVADHNMTAFRVTGPSGKGKIEKSYDDDGEAHGGQRLLGALTKKGATNVAVVVSRVYGGVNIGKRRFELIVETASELLDAVGHVAGKGVAHAWGSGHTLGGGALSAPSPSAMPAAAASAAASSSSASGDANKPKQGKKRKAEAAAEVEAQRRAQLREAAALAAERRMQQLAQQSSSGSAAPGGPK